MSVDERMNTVKKIHACFSCLKKAVREHQQANCSRKKQCKVEGGHQCNSMHHLLLHKSNTAKVGVAVVGDQKYAILPVIATNIGGSNSVYKLGNILFDSGAQISLIRNDTADSLHLSDIDITVNIVKVGGDKEVVKVLG